MDDCKLKVKLFVEANIKEAAQQSVVACNTVGDKIQFKIEKGTQLGIRLRVEKDTELGWYDYAVQKKENLYYVYESEILESNMAQEKYEYETIEKYLTLEEVKQNYPCKYGTQFADIHPLKGQKIFSVEEYMSEETT